MKLTSIQALIQVKLTEDKFETCFKFQGIATNTSYHKLVNLDI